MKIHQLAVTARPDRVRRGRGIAAGRGKTAGRGTKGQNSRAGGGVRVGFEGGQNPWAKRMPKKRGFTPISQVKWQTVNLSQLADWPTTRPVDHAALLAAGLISSSLRPVKLLAGGGQAPGKLNVQLDATSKTARELVAAAGGQVESVLAAPRVRL